ncbi:MAG: hypothetical protein WDO73_11360 [Ignavibacteriota bacterium]
MGTRRFLTAAALATVCLLQAQQPKVKAVVAKPRWLKRKPKRLKKDPSWATTAPVAADSRLTSFRCATPRAIPSSPATIAPCRSPWFRRAAASATTSSAVSRGWHFNAMQAGVPPGRNGQPWLLIDRATATQIPLSYRAWPGTYRPAQVGMSEREFAIHFGGRTAGGFGPGEHSSEADRARWLVSGNLE